MFSSIFIWLLYSEGKFFSLLCREGKSEQIYVFTVMATITINFIISFFLNSYKEISFVLIPWCLYLSIIYSKKIFNSNIKLAHQVGWLD